MIIVINSYININNLNISKINFMDIGKKINSGPGYAICDVENTIILKNLKIFH